MGAKSKKAQIVRSGAEFDIARLRAQISTPVGSGVPLTSWTLAEIFSARDDQLRGHFLRPARLAESMRTDDALAVALENRLAPQRCTRVEMVPARTGRAEAIAGEADALFGQRGVGLSAETLGSIHACLVNHDLAIAQNVAVPREDGSRIDFSVQAWPLENVRWDPYKRGLFTRVDLQTLPTGEVLEGAEIPIVHGDGRWVVFSRYEIEPWKYAALLSAALVWARHAYGLRDWAKSSVAHGCAKVIGEMPAGVALQGEGGATPEAAAFLELLRAIASDDMPIGIRPAGAKTDFLTNNSTAWQIFNELVKNAESAAARIYLGTDGTLGSKGDGPGVDIQTLFGVAATRVEGDLKCIEKAIRTGVIDPWTAVNFGDSTLAPTRKYMLPDGDEAAARADEAARTAAFFDEIDRAKASGFVVTQDYVAKVAAKHGVEAPALPVAPAASVATTPAAPLRAVT